jgi:phage terminase small subunit
MRGNPGRRPLNAREPQPEPVAPDAPEELNEEARREWDRVVGELEINGLITRLDRAALAGIAWPGRAGLTPRRNFESLGRC